MTKLIKINDGTWRETWPIQRNVPAETFIHELPAFFEDVTHDWRHRTDYRNGIDRYWCRRIYESIGGILMGARKTFANPWTEEQRKFVEENYKFMKGADIARAIGRTQGSVSSSIKTLRNRETLAHTLTLHRKAIGL